MIMRCYHANGEPNKEYEPIVIDDADWAAACLESDQCNAADDAEHTYADDYDHGSPDAERTYRQAYQQAAA